MRLEPSKVPMRMAQNYIKITLQHAFESEKEIEQFLKSNYPACAKVVNKFKREIILCEILIPNPNSKEEERLDKLEKRK